MSISIKVTLPDDEVDGGLVLNAALDADSVRALAAWRRRGDAGAAVPVITTTRITAPPPCLDLSKCAPPVWHADVLPESAHVAVSWDGSTVAVTCRSAHVVQLFAAATGAHMATWGTKGYGKGQFREPVAACARPYGGWYVAEWGNMRVQELATDGTHMRFLMEDAFIDCVDMWGVTFDVTHGVAVGVYLKTGWTQAYVTCGGGVTEFAIQLPGARVHMDVDRTDDTIYMYAGDGRTSGRGAPRHMGSCKAMSMSGNTCYALCGPKLVQLLSTSAATMQKSV